MNQSRKYFGHLTSLRINDIDAWLSLSICCSMSGEHEASAASIEKAVELVQNQEFDIRIKFCSGKC